MKSLTYYFHMKMKILADFQICMSVPLMNGKHLHPHYFLSVIPRKMKPRLLSFNKVPRRNIEHILNIEHIRAELTSIEQKLIEEFCLHEIQIKGINQSW